MANHETQLFQSELDKFRPHQQRLVQATHKQTALMKELTKIYGGLLQDKRVKSEQAKYENFTRQRTAVLTKYKKIYLAFNDLIDGLMRAQSFYSEMKDTVESLEKNVETFVNNRRSEGAQLLAQIERDKQMSAGGQADRERDRLKDIMERMSMSPTATSPSRPPGSRPTIPSRPFQQGDIQTSRSPPTSPPSHSNATSVFGTESATMVPRSSYPSSTPHESYQYSGAPLNGAPSSGNAYNPMTYPYQTPASQPPARHYQQNPQQLNQSLPQGYIPPPPPPGPPPNTQGNFGNPAYPHPSGPGGYTQHQHPPRQSSAGGQQQQNDPWAGLNAWK